MGQNFLVSRISYLLECVHGLCADLCSDGCTIVSTGSQRAGSPADGAADSQVFHNYNDHHILYCVIKLSRGKIECSFTVEHNAIVSGQTHLIHSCFRLCDHY